MKIKLLLLALTLSVTGIATAMVGSDANRHVVPHADGIAFVLAPDGYAHATSFGHFAQIDASLGMPALSLIQASLSWADPSSEFGSPMASDRFLLQSYPYELASSQATFHSAAVTSIGDITQVGYYDAAFQLSPHVPEPHTWAMLLAGLGLIALQLRRANRGRMVLN